MNFHERRCINLAKDSSIGSENSFNDSLAQHCSTSSALEMELPKYFAKPSMCNHVFTRAMLCSLVMNILSCLSNKPRPPKQDQLQHAQKHVHYIRIFINYVWISIEIKQSTNFNIYFFPFEPFVMSNTRTSLFRSLILTLIVFHI